MFGIRNGIDRRSHIYILGKTGTGKSSLLEIFAAEDIRRGRGFMLVDPHGDLYENVKRRIGPADQHRLVDLNLPHASMLLSFNPLRDVPEDKRVLVASSLLNTFKKLWSSWWGPAMEHKLRMTLISLLYLPNATLRDIPRMLQDKSFRNGVIPYIKHEEVRRFWRLEYEKIPLRYRAETIAPILNRTGAFLANPVSFDLLTGKGESVDLRDIIDSEKILLVNLAKGKVGEDTAYLIGGLLMASLETATLARADTPEERRRDFSAYLDEVHAYSSPVFYQMFSEARKYKVCLAICQQYTGQGDREMREAILGNVGTIISFRLGSTDSRIMAKEFYPKFSFEDFENLPNHSIYLRMMIDGAVSKPFSADTLDPRRYPFDK